VNVGVAMLGVVGGLVVGIGLALRQRRERSLDDLVRAHGAVSVATVTEIVAAGRQLAFRRVTFVLDAADGGGTFLQTFPFVEFGSLGLDVGAQVRVRQFTDPVSGQVRGRLVQGPAAARSAHVPVLCGVFIVALGIAAALVV
jgi:hypothetical protein